jgi:8-amino-3,8-dideoxy-alpha-D-manno-octulosonate transaminase
MNELTAAVALAQLRKLEGLRAHCRALQSRVVSRIAGLPGIQMRNIPDPTGDSGFEIYFFLHEAPLAVAFTQRLRELNVSCSKGTATYCHYTRDYCRLGLAHNPEASPFASQGNMPAPGYREEDFPRTNELIKRYVALPVGALYTVEDADYIADCVCLVHAELISPAS